MSTSLGPEYGFPGFVESSNSGDEAAPKCPCGVFAYCTVTVPVPVFVMAPEVAVTVMMYVPAVVPDVTTLGQATPPLFPLHATTPPTNAMNNSPKLSIDRPVRPRFGMMKRNKLARAAPLPAYHGTPLGI